MARWPGGNYLLPQPPEATMDRMDDKTRTELEAAVYRRLVEHLRTRTDVQNIDLMNLAGFCRNCLSNWMKDAADAKGLGMSKDESREIVYGMPYEDWRAKHQKEASPQQKAAFDKAKPQH
jgi:hypothetical protein